MTFWGIWLIACTTAPAVSSDGVFTPVALADPLACESHVDCVVSCVVDGSCCEAPCGCTEARNRAADEQLTKARAEQCAGATFTCPSPDCEAAAPVNPRCIEGKCVAVARQD